MGYSLRTWDYRYTLWLGFNPVTFQVRAFPLPSRVVSRVLISTLRLQVNVSDVHAGELYILEDDPGEDANVYSEFDHSQMMRKMTSLPQVGGASLQERVRLHSELIR